MQTSTRPIEFKTKITLLNGHRLPKKNWQKIVARSTVPNRNIFGVAEIDRQRNMHGAYYDTWRIVLEERGYIFREINSGAGISGYSPTVKELITKALSFEGIRVFLEE